MNGREAAFIEAFCDVDAAIKVALRVCSEYARCAHGTTRAMLDVAVASIHSEVRRSALASKDANEPYDLNKIRKRENAGPLIAHPQERVSMTYSEYDRLRAWKEFGENVLAVARAHPVVAVLLDKEMPQDAGEPKP